MFVTVGTGLKTEFLLISIKIDSNSFSRHLFVHSLIASLKIERIPFHLLTISWGFFDWRVR